MTNTSKQLIMFLLGKEKGELILAFQAKRISKKQYDAEFQELVNAVNETLEL